MLAGYRESTGWQPVPRKTLAAYCLSTGLQTPATRRASARLMNVYTAARLSSRPHRREPGDGIGGVGLRGITAAGVPDPHEKVFAAGVANGRLPRHRMRRHRIVSLRDDSAVLDDV